MNKLHNLIKHFILSVDEVFDNVELMEVLVNIWEDFHIRHDVCDLVLVPIEFGILREHLLVWEFTWVKFSIFVVFHESVKFGSKFSLELSVLWHSIKVDEFMWIIHKVIHFPSVAIELLGALTVEVDEFVSISTDTIVSTDLMPAWVLIVVIVHGLAPLFACFLVLSHERKQ